ncbi:MAG: class F sortase [Dehalococcoidia bacterium]|nr:class F sortase [Dehalococcoidia bacterium]
MSRRRLRRWVRRRRGALLGAALAANLVALVVLIVLVTPREAPEVPTSAQYAELFAHRAIRADVHGEPQPPSVLAHAVATALPTPETFDAPVARLVIDRIGVDAPVEVLGVDSTGTMESPDGPDVVAWYGFTAKPGQGGNAVFSGHVDYVRHGPAVFWDLRKLQPGDGIEVRLADGTRIEYAVTAARLYPVDEVPMEDVLAPTSTESVTLITCGGTFGGGQYSHRLVLRAARTEVVRPS